MNVLYIKTVNTTIVLEELMKNNMRVSQKCSWTTFLVNEKTLLKDITTEFMEHEWNFLSNLLERLCFLSGYLELYSMRQQEGKSYNIGLRAKFRP